MFDICSRKSEWGIAELQACSPSLDRTEQNQKQQLSTVSLLPCFGDPSPLSSFSSALQGVETHWLPSVCLEFNLQLMSSKKVTSLVN